MPKLQELTEAQYQQYLSILKYNKQGAKNYLNLIHCQRNNIKLQTDIDNTITKLRKEGKHTKIIEALKKTHGKWVNTYSVFRMARVTYYVPLILDMVDKGELIMKEQKKAKRTSRWFKLST